MFNVLTWTFGNSSAHLSSWAVYRLSETENLGKMKILEIRLPALKNNSPGKAFNGLGSKSARTFVIFCWTNWNTFGSRTCRNFQKNLIFVGNFCGLHFFITILFLRIVTASEEIQKTKHAAIFFWRQKRTFSVTQKRRRACVLRDARTNTKCFDLDVTENTEPNFVVLKNSQQRKTLKKLLSLKN